MVSRRAFVKDGALALVSLGFAPSFLARTVSAAGSRGKVLIAIFQRGAVDGLSMIVPFAEKAYYDARPTIAVAKPGGRDEGGIDLDGFFALHPRLAPLAPIYGARHLALVHAVGSPDNTRSHFDAQDYMETATPGVKSTSDGWLNRYLQARKRQDATPFRAVAVSPQLPRALHGQSSALALSQIAQFGVRPGRAGAGAAQAFAFDPRSRLYAPELAGGALRIDEHDARIRLGRHQRDHLRAGLDRPPGWNPEGRPARRGPRRLSGRIP